MKGNAQFLECLGQLGIDLLRPVTVLLGSRIIDNILEINFRDIQMGPVRNLHLLPFAEGVKPEVQKPLRFILLRRNQPYDILIQAFRDELLLHIRHEPMLILLAGDIFKYILFFILVHNI